MTFKRFGVLGAAAAGLVLAADVSFGGDGSAPEPANETFPYIASRLDLTFADDYVFQSTIPGSEVNNLSPEAISATQFGLTPFLAVNLGLTFEQVATAAPSEHRIFADLGLYVDTLNVEVTAGHFAFFAGKFGPGFGHAWEITPGVYGTDFAEDYELAEQIGFGVAYGFTTETAGTHLLGANIFVADTTVLSESLFTNRGRLTIAKGGVGNSGRLNNFSLTLDGEGIPFLPGFSYHLGYRHLSPGVGGLGAEDGYVAGFAWEKQLSSGHVLGLTGEVAHFSNFDGTLDSATYFTPGLSVTKGHWHGELSGTVRRINFHGAGGQTHLLAQVSGGYTFGDGVDFSAAYAYSQDPGVRSHVLGLTLTKTFNFSSR